MRIAAFALTAASLAVGACATGAEAPLAETEYPRGSLAVAALDRGDFERAELLLTKRRQLSESNPARLLNLATVYARTGRPELARDTWRRVLASDRQAMVATTDGRHVSTRQLAREALATVDLETAAR